MPATAVAQIELSRPGWVAPRLVDAANVSVFYGMNQPGRLSAFFPAGTRFPHGGDPKGLWWFYRHPIHGPTGGVVEDAPTDAGQGTVELAGRDFAGTLAYRLTPHGYRQRAATAGELVTRMLSDSAADAPVPWEVVADEEPPYVDFEWRDETVLEAITSLAQATGQDWRVTVSHRRAITFEWRKRMGRDRRAKVLLCDGYGVGGRVDDSTVGLVNAIRAAANDRRWQDATRTTVEDAASVERYGRRRAARFYADVGTKPTLEPKARADLAASSRAAITADLTMAHTDPRGLLIREGDVFRYQSRAQGKRLDVRAMGREVNTASGLVRIVGAGEAPTWAG